MIYLKLLILFALSRTWAADLPNPTSLGQILDPGAPAEACGKATFGVLTSSLTHMLDGVSVDGTYLIARRIHELRQSGDRALALLQEKVNSVATAKQPGPILIPIQLATEIFSEACQIAYRIFSDQVTHNPYVETSIDISLAHRAIFEKAFFLALHPETADHELISNDYLEHYRGGLLILDTPVTVPGVPRGLYRGLNRDHHGPWFDESTPYQNTTGQILEVLQEVHKFRPRNISLAEKITYLRKYAGMMSSDNLGDTIWTIYLFDQVDVMLRSPTDRRLVEQATLYEDFKSFGRDWDGPLAPREVLEAVELQQALFNQFTDLLNKYVRTPDLIPSSDRFTMLPPEQQTALMHEALSALKRIRKESRFRYQQAAQFRERREAAQKTISTSHQQTLSEIRKTLPREQRALLDAVDRHVYIFRSGESFAQHGVFPTWTASAHNHNHQLQLNFTPQKNGKLVIVLSVVDGTSSPFPLEDFVARLKAANIRKSGEGAGQAISVRGKTLAFSFVGVDLTEAEVIREIGLVIQEKEAAVGRL